MNILCTFRIAVSWVWYTNTPDQSGLVSNNNEGVLPISQNS